MRNILIILSSFLFLTSCSSDSEGSSKPELEEVTFSFSKQNREDLTASKTSQRSSSTTFNETVSSLLTNEEIENLEPFALIVSILNDKNEVVLSNKELLLFSTNDVDFISEPVSLEIGDYSITTFNVINSENEVIYASPFEGSDIADSINFPLPIPFSVDDTVETNTAIVTPEVILVLETDTPELFGFTSFSFDIIERQSLFISATESTNEIVSEISTPYTITIEGTDIVLTGTLENGSNSVNLPILGNNVEIYITLQHDSVNQTKTIISREINNYTELNPLAINFINLTTPIPTFTYSSDNNYAVQTFTNTTLNTGSIQWTLPVGATLVNGSLTDNEISLSFPGSGNYEIGLQVTSFGFDENGDAAQLTGEATKEIPIVTSLSEIRTPFIIAGGFEVPDDYLITTEGLGRSDLGKEYWLPDGVSTRVLHPETLEQFIAYPGEVDYNLYTWFAPEAFAEFNRIGISGHSRSGVAAASWDRRTQLRAAVQHIEVTPGVDYKITFWYENVENETDVSLLALVLDERVKAENQIGTDNKIDGLDNSIIAQGAFNEQASGYIEEIITFNSEDRTAIKLYFNTSDISGQYRLDDISIKID